MFRLPGSSLSQEKIEILEQQIVEEARAGREEAAWRKLKPLRRAQHRQEAAAKCLLRIINRKCLSTEGALELLSEVSEAHHQDVNILTMLGESVEAVRDIDDLNASPPEHPVFQTVFEKLAALAETDNALDAEKELLFALGTSARMLARQGDGIAEECFKRLTVIDPKNSAYHYNLGLFFKTRGRFEEGMKSNQTAANLLHEEDEGVEWNLGICATGSGNGPFALDVWKRMGHEIEMGRFGLPEGHYSQCKVKLAERPLAERTADIDNPGTEETIWIERLSPCHGVIRSVLSQDLGVDYGDVILIDGAPITYHTYGDAKIPVFPHLATLIRQNYQFFDFAGTQDQPDRLADASAELEADTVIYSHSENVQDLCASCWRDPDLDHEHHERLEKNVVIGRIAAPKDTDPIHLLDQIDKAIAKHDPCQLYVPDLCRMAGFEDRAQVEKRRFDLLRDN